MATRLAGGRLLEDAAPDEVLAALATSDETEVSWWNAVREWGVMRAQDSSQRGDLVAAASWCQVVCAAGELAPISPEDPSFLVSKINLVLLLRRRGGSSGLPSIEDLASESSRFIADRLDGATPSEAATFAETWSDLAMRRNIPVSTLLRWRRVKHVLRPFSSELPVVLNPWATVYDLLP